MGIKKRKRSSHRGATLVEAAIAFPIILLIFLLVVEAFMYMARLAVMNYAVQEGATLASTVEGLRSPDAPTRDAALQQVRDRTWQFTSWVLSDPSKFTSPNGEVPPVIVNVGNEATPIRIELWASYLPINPLLRINGPLRIRAQAFAFRDEGPGPPSKLPNCAKNDPRPECQCAMGGNEGGQSFCSCPWPFIENELGQCVCAPSNCTLPKVLNPTNCACECPHQECGLGQYFDNNTCSCKCSPQSCPENQYWDSASCSCKCDCWRLEEYCRTHFHHRSRCVNNNEGVVACECTTDCYGGYTGENCETCDVNLLHCNPPFTWPNPDTCRCECPQPRGDNYCRSQHPCSYYRWDTCACSCSNFNSEFGSYTQPNFPACSPPSDFCTSRLGKQSRTVTNVNESACWFGCDCPEPLEATGPDSCGGGSG